MNKFTSTHIIFFVKNQDISTLFYENLFSQKPTLHVPGMTEFVISENLVLGLMPENGIAKIIAPPMKHPSLATDIPRCELYFYVDNIEEQYKFIKKLPNINIVSDLLPRTWGDIALYISDPDGHIVVFAQKTTQ